MMALAVLEVGPQAKPAPLVPVAALPVQVGLPPQAVVGAQGSTARELALLGHNCSAALEVTGLAIMRVLVLAVVVAIGAVAAPVERPVPPPVVAVAAPAMPVHRRRSPVWVLFMKVPRSPAALERRQETTPIQIEVGLAVEAQAAVAAPA